MYVQEFKLARPSNPLPVLLWHGGGLTGGLWETNATGEAGWLMRLLERGFDVFSSDAVGMGRSSWAHLETVYDEKSIFRSRQEAWSLFRIGHPNSYEQLVAHPESQFPVESFDNFTRAIVPRWTGMEKISAEAYCDLVERVGPCLIIAHSSGALYAYEAVERYPDLVKGICLVEPSFSPPWDLELATKRLSKTKIMQIFGDHMDKSPYWAELRQQARDAADAISASVDMTWLDLPAIGIHGNTHCPMSDRNSDQIADIVADWLCSAI